MALRRPVRHEICHQSPPGYRPVHGVIGMRTQTVRDNREYIQGFCMYCHEKVEAVIDHDLYWALANPIYIITEEPEPW